MYSLGELVLGVLSSVIATVLCGLVVEGYRRRNERRPFARLLNFTKTERTVFVFPSRPDAPEHPGLLQDARVAFEDMLAINYVRRALTLAGWQEDMFDMREHRHFREHDSHDSAKNVVVLCSPRSNPITREFLDKINESTALNWGFRETETKELEIYTDGGAWSSATFGQERSIRQAGGAVEEGPLDDVVLILKAPNPYNPAAKVLIIAGIRGIGTWGGAKYLRQHAEDVVLRTGEKNFAMLLKVAYRKWEIESVNEVGLIKTF